MYTVSDCSFCEIYLPDLALVQFNCLGGATTSKCGKFKVIFISEKILGVITKQIDLDWAAHNLTLLKWANANQHNLQRKLPK